MLLLDPHRAGALRRNELWSGLFDLGCPPPCLPSPYAGPHRTNVHRPRFLPGEIDAVLQGCAAAAAPAAPASGGGGGCEAAALGARGEGSVAGGGEEEEGAQARAGPHDEWVRASELPAGLQAMLRTMAPARVARLERCVDMAGEERTEEDAEGGGADEARGADGNPHVEFAVAAARRARARQLARKLPAGLANLKLSLAPADLRKARRRPPRMALHAIPPGWSARVPGVSGAVLLAECAQR
jgi:hypothetical protein